jgi:hypothetical protein
MESWSSTVRHSPFLTLTKPAMANRSLYLYVPPNGKKLSPQTTFFRPTNIWRLSEPTRRNTQVMVPALPERMFPAPIATVADEVPFPVFPQKRPG